MASRRVQSVTPARYASQKPSSVSSLVLTTNVGPGCAFDSYAPISHSVRVTPRWSVVGQPVLVPLFSAGELSCSEKVSVGPPLSASGLRTGSEPIMFPFAPLVRSQALAPFSIKLLEEAPFNDIPPLLTQSPPLVLFAIITFFR